MTFKKVHCELLFIQNTPHSSLSNYVSV